MFYLKLLGIVTNCIISVYFECLMCGPTESSTERGKRIHRSLYKVRYCEWHSLLLVCAWCRSFFHYVAVSDVCSYTSQHKVAAKKAIRNCVVSTFLE